MTMNTSNPDPNPSPAQTGDATSAALDTLRKEVDGLQKLFAVAVGAVIVLSLAIGLFTFIQMKIFRTQLNEQRAAAARIDSGYKEVSEPLIRNFTAAMEQFAATNKDFQPILDKYRPALANILKGKGGAAP